MATNLIITVSKHNLTSTITFFIWTQQLNQDNLLVIEIDFHCMYKWKYNNYSTSLFHCTTHYSIKPRLFIENFFFSFFFLLNILMRSSPAKTVHRKKIKQRLEMTSNADIFKAIPIMKSAEKNYHQIHLAGNSLRLEHDYIWGERFLAINLCCVRTNATARSGPAGATPILSYVVRMAV